MASGQTPSSLGTIGKLIADLRDKKGWTQDDLAARMGMLGSQISKREHGKTRISYRERQKFASVFDIPFEEFEALCQPSKVHDRPPPRGIPIINKGPAGVVRPYDHDQYSGGEYHDPESFADRGEPGTEYYIGDELAFGLIIIGDSMEPELHEGDLAIFTPITVPKPKAKLEAGDIVFVRFAPESRHDGVTVARWSQTHDGTVVFSKDNKRYPAIIASTEEIAQLAVCIETRVKRKKPIRA